MVASPRSRSTVALQHGSLRLETFPSVEKRQVVKKTFQVSVSLCLGVPVSVTDVARLNRVELRQHLRDALADHVALVAQGGELDVGLFGVGETRAKGIDLL